MAAIGQRTSVRIAMLNLTPPQLAAGPRVAQFGKNEHIQFNHLREGGFSIV